MGITLLDEIAQETNPLRKGIIMALVEQVMLQDRVPYESVGALNVPVTYLSDIPSVPLRHINETPGGVQARYAQAVETLHIIDTDIEIDPVLLAVKNQVMSVEVAQTRAIMKSIGYRINQLMVNGDPNADSREPRGMKVRLRDDARMTGQTVNATGDANELDCSPDASDANLLTWLNKIDELMLLLEDNVSFLLSNRQARLSFWAGLRKLKILDTTRDQFDREITVYRGVPILDAGFVPTAAIDGTPDATTVESNQIIGYDADDYSAGNDPGVGNGANAYTTTSTIYAVRTGDEYSSGLQLEALRVKPFGETETPPHFHRTNIRWVLNPLVAFQKRSMARLVGCQFT